MPSIYDNEPWLGQPPEIPDEEIREVIEADVVVVGGGLAGIAAVRQATELGAKVVLFEKCKTPQARSGDFALMDSKIADTWGRRDIDKVEIVNDLMKDMCYKVSQDILKRWADEAGEAFDWYIEGYPDIPVLKETREVPPPRSRCWIQPRRLPLPPTFDNDKERFKCHQVTAWVRPTHIPVFRGNLELARATGLLTCYFNAPVQRLLREDGGRIEGVIARDENGHYVKAIARKGVVLSTGDYMSNNAMLRRFVPGVADTPQHWTSLDREQRPSNTGDGHKLGMWIGAKLQDSPHAPLNHHMGSVFGASDFLLLNTRGQRFVNEDAPGQQIGSQIENLPNKQAWQLVDGNWRDQIPDVYPNHGSVCYILEDEELEGGDIYNRLCFIDNMIAPKYIEKAVEEGKLLRADSLEELFAQMDIPADVAKASVERYNQLSHGGRDEDFGKNPMRMFPVEKPPFYAAKFTPALMIAVLGGLQSDEEARVYDNEGRVIPGLYVAGNVQGNRLAVEYPLTVPGLSHSLALTYGRIAGRNAARAI